jgi:hypothetical protein
MRFSERMNRIWNAKIGDPLAKLLLLAINERVSGEGNYCYPSQSILARETDMTDRTIRNKLSLLIKLGYLSIEHRINAKTGKKTSNLYTIHFEAFIPKEKPDNTPEIIPDHQRNHVPMDKPAEPHSSGMRNQIPLECGTTFLWNAERRSDRSDCIDQTNRSDKKKHTRIVKQTEIPLPVAEATERVVQVVPEEDAEKKPDGIPVAVYEATKRLVAHYNSVWEANIKAGKTNCNAVRRLFAASYTEEQGMDAISGFKFDTWVDRKLKQNCLFSTLIRTDSEGKARNNVEAGCGILEDHKAGNLNQPTAQKSSSSTYAKTQDTKREATISNAVNRMLAAGQWTALETRDEETLREAIDERLNQELIARGTDLKSFRSPAPQKSLCAADLLKAQDDDQPF